MRVPVCWLALALVTSMATADPVSIFVRGGAAAPCAEETDIRMVSEDLNVELYDMEAVVRASFVFRNEGPAHEALIGFPQVNYSQAKTLVLRDVRFVIDGEELRADHLPHDSTEAAPAAPGYEFESWHVVSVPFDSGQERHVEIDYRHEHGHSAVGIGAGWDWFPYLLATGARWKGGTVERINVVLNYHEGVDRIHQIRTEGYRHNEDERQITWSLPNYHGDPAVIEVRWWRKGLTTHINGQPLACRAFVGCDGPVIWLSGGEKVPGLEWVSQPADGCDAEVESNGHRLGLGAGSREAALDGAPLTLTRAPDGDPFQGNSITQSCGLLAEDLRRAFGLEWTYDPETRVLDLRL